ncbi:hypothetical protein SCHPADRAFT_978612 [Schizopora paradoxa]|uniref:Uncharacterized protein n=1 Tax=Schizopora paradoxa TaxID=27342 RepID=A0A0H2RDQ3_9AGAM|nr:hypothetical protein SCHPADRAFT_978612 [Schizopora paradoxa]
MLDAVTNTPGPWDPFAGATELLRLVFGDAVSFLDDSHGLESPLRSPISSSLDSHSPTQSIRRNPSKTSRTAVSLSDDRSGDNTGAFKDFLGVPETPDQDALDLLELKEKYRTNTPLPQIESRSLPTQSLSSTAQINDPQPNSGGKDASGDGTQKSAIGGWEPSEGDSLPLVDISFDSSLLRPAQVTSTISRPFHEELSGMPTKPSRQAGNSNVKIYPGPLPTTNSYNVTPSTSAGRGNTISGRTGPSGLTPTNDIAGRRVQAGENRVLTAQSNAPAAAQPKQRLGKVVTLPPSATQERSSNIVDMDSVRKLHTLVPPQLAKSITKSTLKAREDESMRLRLQQQDGPGFLKNVKQSGGAMTTFRTGSADGSLLQRPASEAKRIPYPMQPLSNESRPNSTPAVLGTPSDTQVNGFRQPSAQAPLAVARQVAVSLPATQFQNSTLGLGLPNHKPMQSVTPQVSASHNSQDQVNTLGAELTGALSRTIGFRFDHEQKENDPARVVHQTSGAQPNIRPLADSNVTNTQDLRSSSASEALQTLKRAWSDAEVGHVGSSLQKKHRLL